MELQNFADFPKTSPNAKRLPEQNSPNMICNMGFLLTIYRNPRITKMLLPPVLRFQSCQSVAIHPVSPPQAPSPVLRPRRYQSVAIYCVPPCLAASELPECRCFYCVPAWFCGLRVAKVSLSCFPPVLRLWTY